jgi:tetratricopeptide (TPR) repeat protein
VTSEDSLRGKEVSLTGRLASMKRAEAIRRITEAGGLHVDIPGTSTALLVAGPAGHLTPSGNVTRNLLRFRDLKQNGSPIRLIDEIEFLRLLGASDELSDFSRLYTLPQVSRIIETPLPVLRSWLRKGLLQPARTTNRLAWFEITDILQARNLSRLTAHGVPASQIRESMEQIARWLPEGSQLMGRLDAFEQRLRVKLPDGGWADPSGQRLIGFEQDAGAAGTRVSAFPQRHAVADGERLAEAEDAEERGDLAEAAEGYARILQDHPEAEAYFNLGNALYQLAREAEAAQRYLQALELDPEFAEAWNNLGNSLVAIGKAEDAILAYRRALLLEPNYPDAHCNLATLLERQGRHDESEVHRAACLKAFPSEARLRLLREPAADDPEG